GRVNKFPSNWFDCEIFSMYRDARIAPSRSTGRVGGEDPGAEPADGDEADGRQDDAAGRGDLGGEVAPRPAVAGGEGTGELAVERVPRQVAERPRSGRDLVRPRREGPAA